MTRKLAVMDYNQRGNSVSFKLIDEGGPDDRTPYYRHGAKYGNGGFTGQRCMTHLTGPYEGQRVFFRMRDHLNRLFDTVEALEWLKIPWTEELLEDAMCRLMVANPGDNYFSLVFASGGDVGVMPKGQAEHFVFINSRSMDAGAYLGERIVREGMVVRITEPDIRRGPPGKLAWAKVSGNYATSNVAKYRAIQAGADDAIICDYSGKFVAELTVANLICLDENGILVTPDASSGALPSITRRTIMEMATKHPHEIITDERSIPLDELSHMRMMIACGTAIGAVRIRQINHWSGEVVWEQDQEDCFATGLAKDLIDGVWEAMYGQDSWAHEYHPEWYTPIPARYLRERQQALPLE